MSPPTAGGGGAGASAAASIALMFACSILAVVLTATSVASALYGLSLQP